MSTRDWSVLQEDFQIFIQGVKVPNPMQVLAESPLLGGPLEAVRTAGYAKPTLIQMQVYVKKLPLLDDTAVQDGPCAIILALRRELVTQIERVLNQCNYIVSDKADKIVDIGFENYVTRTLLAIPNIHMKVSSEDVSTVIQPQKGSAAFRKPDIDHDDDENKAHWAEKTLEQMSTRDCILQGDFQIFIRGVQCRAPCRSGPRMSFSGSCSRRCTRQAMRSRP